MLVSAQLLPGCSILGLRMLIVLVEIIFSHTLYLILMTFHVLVSALISRLSFPFSKKAVKHLMPYKTQQINEVCIVSKPTTLPC